MEKTRTKEILELFFVSLLGVLTFIGASVRYSQVEYYTIPFFDKYFFVTLLFGTVCSLFLLVKKWQWNKEIAIFLLLWVSLLLFQAKDIRSVSIWLDEDYQIWTSLHQLPIQAGWNQHQPPLHLALLGGWMSIVEPSEFSARVFTLLFSASGAAFVAFYIRSWLSSWWPVIGIMPLYLFQPYIVRYSYEVRPVGIGLFCMIVWFGAMIRLLKLDKPTLNSGIPIAVFTFFSLISVGFQPPIFGLLLAVAVCLSPYKVRNKIIALSAMLLGFLLFLPIQVQILQEAPPRFTRVGDFSISDLINSLSLKTFLPFARSFFLPVLPFAAIVILFGVLIQKDWRWLIRFLRETTLFAVVLGLVFIVAVPFFSYYLDWPLNPYYLLATWPLVIFWLAHLLRRSFAPKLLLIPSIIFCLLFIVLQLFPNPFFRDYSNFIEPRADMRGAIQKILSIADDRKRTVLFPVCGGNSNEWCPNWIVGRDVYLNKSATANLSLVYSMGYDPYFFRNYFSRPQPDERIIWLFQEEWSRYQYPREFSARPPAFYEVGFLRVVLLVQDGIQGDARLGVYEGLKKFEEISRSAGRDAFWLRIQLAMAAKGLGRKDEYKFWRDNLPTDGKNVDGKVWLKMLDESSERLKEQKKDL